MDGILPKALVIGPQKAGTTWIHEYLAQRGDVCLPSGVKETFFFDRYYGRGLEWYERHFQGCGEGRMAVEVAPTYFHTEEVAVRVKSELGEIPLVATLRHPVERTFSLYLHMLRYGMTRLSFAEALKEHPELIETSLYAKHLGRWFDEFGRDKVLVVFQEDLSVNCEAFAESICSHLGLAFEGIPERLKDPVNIAAMPPSPALASLGQRVADALRWAGLYGLVELAKRLGLKSVFFGGAGSGELPVIEEGDRMRLMKIFLPDIEELERMLGRDLSHWKEG